MKIQVFVKIIVVCLVPIPNEEKIMTLFDFQVLQTEAILGLEINSLS